MFTVAGTSKVFGKVKVRYANDMTRVKVLLKGGHEDIDLIELPNAMSKEDIVAYLIKIDFANGNAEKAEAINAEAAKRKVGAVATSAKSNVKVTAKAAVKATAEPKKKIVPRPEIPFAKDVEDAPF